MFSLIIILINLQTYANVFWFILLLLFLFLIILYLDARNPYRYRLISDKSIDRFDTRTIKLHLFDWMYENILLNFSDRIPEFIVNLFLPLEIRSPRKLDYIELDKINRITAREPRWQQVAMDLHVHTDVLDILPSRKKCHYVRKRAITNGLNGIACTCHNRVRFPEYSVEFTDANFLWLTSQEITLQPPFNLDSQKKRGSNKYLNSFHCNAHGTTRTIQQTPMMSTQDVINEIKKNSGIANFNHPSRSLFDFFSLFDTVEIWNGKRIRLDVINLWEDKYLEGIYRPGLAGSDFHSHKNLKGYSDVGLPRTVLLVNELNRANVLEAMTKGRCYLTSGSIIDFWIQVGNTEFDMGSKVEVKPKETCKIFANGITTVNGNAKVRINKKYMFDTKLINQIPFEIQETLKPEEDLSIRIDIFNEKNELILITNPVFIKISQTHN